MVGNARELGAVGQLKAVSVCRVNANQHGVAAYLGDKSVNRGRLGQLDLFDHGNNVGIGMLVDVAKIGELNLVTLAQVAHDVGVLVNLEGD